MLTYLSFYSLDNPILAQGAEDFEKISLSGILNSLSSSVAIYCEPSLLI